MQFDIETLEPVRKRVRVEVPAAKVDSTFAQVFNQISQSVSMPGFRRGKVPTSVLRKRYGAQANVDVTQRLIEEGWRALLDEHSVIPLGEPEIDSKPVEQGKTFSFEFSFEVVPDFDLEDFSKISVEQTTWNASEEVVEHELTHIAEQVASYELIDDRTKAENDDMAVIDYLGKVDDVPFAGGAANDAELLLGSGQFIPGFEEQIVGHEVGEEFDINVDFPEDYGAENLAGQTAVFTINLKGLKNKVTPEIGPDLAEKVGEENMDAVRTRLKEEIENRFAERSKSEERDVIRDQLGGYYSFELPPSLLNSGIADRRNQMVMEAIQSGTPREEAEAGVDEKMEAEQENIVNGLRSMLVLDRIAQDEEIMVMPRELSIHIEQIIQQTGPYGAQIRQMYQDPARRAGLARRLKHDKVLDFLLTKATVSTVEKDVPEHNHDEDHDHGDGQEIENTKESGDSSE